MKSCALKVAEEGRTMGLDWELMDSPNGVAVEGSLVEKKKRNVRMEAEKSY